MSSGVSIVSAGTSAYTVVLDEVSDTLTYVGKAAPRSSTADPVWQIRRLSKSGTVLSVEYASGDDSFTNVWDDRASLEYS